MLLCIDIGNTNIVLGVFAGPDLKGEFRLKTDAERTVDEYCALLSNLLPPRGIANAKIKGATICSVVPPVTPDLVAVVKTLFGIEPLVIGPGMKSGIHIDTIEPAAVGADRIVNAVAVRELYGAPAIVVDFGTATTFDVVGKAGAYEGGIIAPGAAVSMEALVRRTAKLPRIELAWPKQVLGRSTVTAMQSGNVVGYLCMVDGLLQRLIDEQGPIGVRVATGGLGRLFTEHSRLLTEYDPHLTLKGMRLIAELNGVCG